MSETASSLVKSLRIGRYFNIVSVTTSSILVTFIAGLVAAGALEGTPSLERLIGTIKTLNLADGALFTLGTLLVGLMLHPLQYALVQMLEGYWGGNHVAILAMDAAAVLHVHRWDKLATGYLYAKGLSQGLSSLDDDRVGDPLDWERQDRRLRYLEQETARLLGKYPQRQRILPTTLGNRLRRGEDTAGQAWGIDGVTAAPTISLVAEQRDDNYLADTTAEGDLAVRFCIVWILATAISTLLLWHDGLWLSVPIATYVLAYVSYRGAAVAAEEQNAAMDAMISLNRFALYDRLGIRRPTSTIEERKQNKNLMRLLRGNNTVWLNYGEATATAQASNPPHPEWAEQPE